MRLDADWLTAAPARAVMTMLADAGHQALFVGGCVRNALLDAPVSDLDLSTDAHPSAVMALAKRAGLRAIPTGIDHGTVTVIADGTPIEITTFRRDVATDGRRAVVAFADTMAEDAQRRDFTMNALYVDAAGQVHDPVGGLPDLRARRIRFIGDAHDRVREDYLRILRFFRFWAWYGDQIDADGLAACAELADGLAQIAKERIGAEMRKLLAAPDPAPAVASMGISGVLHRILPGADPAALVPLIHVEQMAGAAPDAVRRLAALGGEGAADALRLSKAQAAALARAQAAMASDAGPRALGYLFGEAPARDALIMRAAMGQPWDAAALDVAAQGAGLTLPIRAADLMPAVTGPALGAALKAAEARWIASDFKLTRDDLLRP